MTYFFASYFMNLRLVAIILAFSFAPLGALAPLGVLAPVRAFAHGTPDNIAALAEKLTPAVVNIAITQTVKSNQRQGGNLRDLFEDFFRQQQPQQPPQQRQQPQKVSSLGSGFVIDPSGIIVTNYHVIKSADEITVTFPSGDDYQAEILGRDMRTDIAILKIESKTPLPFVKMGDSNAARVGDWVIAIGNPFGLGSSLSVGVVSAINRDINAGPYDSFIQTDAAINKGNSGGPLFNLKGEVIGVNSAIISPTGGSVGIGFAISADLANTVIAQLQKFGETRRGWLGVSIQPVDEKLADNLGLESAYGALVSSIIDGGPAAQYGIKQGDVIVKFDGKPIKDMRDLPRIVAETPVGKRVRVDVFRRGRPRAIIVKIERLEDQAAANPRAQRSGQNERVDSSIQGMELRDINDVIRRRFELSGDIRGVLVANVDSNSDAFEAGIRKNDVLLEIDYERVSTVAQARKLFSAAIDDKNKSSVLLLMQASRGGRTGQRYLALPLKKIEQK